GICNSYLKKHAEAVADWEAALALNPTDDNLTAFIRNNLAWTYATGSPAIRAPEKALPLALQAVGFAPHDPVPLHTLGVVYYRLGQWDRAIATLEHSLKSSQCPPNELFFLALARLKLGDRAKARECYDQAVAWIKGREKSLEPRVRDDLNAFRMEAEAM